MFFFFARGDCCGLQCGDIHFVWGIFPEIGANVIAIDTAATIPILDIVKEDVFDCQLKSNLPNVTFVLTGIPYTLSRKPFPLPFSQMTEGEKILTTNQCCPDWGSSRRLRS